jgi:sugar lactone lactonase YvrE
VRPEQVTAAEFGLGETPVWLPAQGGLLWVDGAAGDVVRLARNGATERWHVAGRVAVVRATTSGGLVLALDDCFALAAGWGEPVERLGALWPEADLWFNDGGCDPQGRFWAGTASADYAGTRCGLYRLDPDRTVSRVLDGVGLSNGLAWSPDGSLAYYADTLTGRVDVFDADPERGLVGRRPFASFDPADGHPDGLCVDAGGRVWVAMWDGGAVRCHEPDGTLAEVVEVPVRQVTACTFGGADLGELYITTKREGHRPEEAATAGAVFRVRPGVAGLPALPYAG